MLSTTARIMLATTLTAVGLAGAGLNARAWALGQPGVSAALMVGLPQAVAAAPSFVYGHGAQGLSFYRAPAQQQQAPRAAAAPRATAATPPRRHREFGSGRSVPLAKPWLNQFR